MSDVLPVDFAALLNALADPQSFYSTPSDEDQQAGRKPAPLSEQEASDLEFLFQSLSGYHQEGQLTIRSNPFWTHAGSMYLLGSSLVPNIVLACRSCLQNETYTIGNSLTLEISIGYWRLPTTDPRLYEDLKESELVIFKGDLNYRKLTADVRLMTFPVMFC